MRSCAVTYYLIVVEDTELEKIVACGTLIVEQKFIHTIALVCITLHKLFSFLGYKLYMGRHSVARVVLRQEDW